MPEPTTSVHYVVLGIMENQMGKKIGDEVGPVPKPWRQGIATNIMVLDGL